MTKQTTPDWARDAVSTKLQPVVEVADAPKTDSERIADARARSMKANKEWVAEGKRIGYDIERDDSFYKDFAGPETSAWDADRWEFVAELLETPILKEPKYRRPAYHCNGLTEIVVPIAELKAAVNARIEELGLSAVKVWEWFLIREPHSDFGRAIWREDLTTRIERFKATA